MEYFDAVEYAKEYPSIARRKECNRFLSYLERKKVVDLCKLGKRKKNWSYTKLGEYMMRKHPQEYLVWRTKQRVLG